MRGPRGKQSGRYCRFGSISHIVYEARVYVALNTLLYDDELKPAERLITELYRVGVDALIVQDMGVLRLDIPPIALHASTQTDNRTVEKVRFLYDAGFSRVVLARELSGDQIRTIAEAVRWSWKFLCMGLCVSVIATMLFESGSFGAKRQSRGMCPVLPSSLYIARCPTVVRLSETSTCFPLKI